MKKDVFVVRHGDEWGVRTTGSSRLVRVFEKKTMAVDYGKDMAKSNRSELRVQNSNGQFGICNSYGQDPHPPHDKNR